MQPSRRIAQYSHRVAVLTATFHAGLLAVAALAQTPPVPQEQVQRGAYLARAGDCIACHTAPKGAPYAGGLPLDTPIGRVYSTNITPDLETGIGQYNADDFVKVMRTGVAKDGHRLYPAMPYTSYAKLSQEDLLALYAFFMQGIPPVRQLNHPTRLKWPLRMRSLMAVWNGLYLKKGEFVADSNQNAAWNRGAYLVQGLGHCGGCHTPRGVAGQEKADSERKGRYFLAGATLDNWETSPLTGNLDTGLHAWSKDEVVEFLKTGRTARVAAFGAMAGAVRKSTQYLTDQDLMAIAEYLKSLPPSRSEERAHVEPVMQASQASAA